jgi:hypothetical protein
MCRWPPAWRCSRRGGSDRRERAGRAGMAQHGAALACGDAAAVRRLTGGGPNAYPSRSFSPADRHYSLPHRSQREA